MAEAFTFDYNRGRLDIDGASVRGLVHPQRRAHHHALSTANYLPASLFGTPHETGHGLYEQGVDPAYTRSVLATDLSASTRWAAPASAPMNPSRAFGKIMWDAAGASGSAISTICSADFPGVYDDVSAEEFYRAVTRVEPGLIRVESRRDEL